MSKWPVFQDYVGEGDSITCERDGFTLTATVYWDDCVDAPDQRQDGYWPSLDPESAGYIGPKSKRTLERHMAKAKAIMDAWKRDEWWYVGVAVTVSKAGVQLTEQYHHALWGVECNYPGGRKGKRNAYLSQVAEELTGEALAEAKAKLAALCAA